jgi:hypothetical protein
MKKRLAWPYYKNGHVTGFDPIYILCHANIFSLDEKFLRTSIWFDPHIKYGSYQTDTNQNSIHPTTFRVDPPHYKILSKSVE